MSKVMIESGSTSMKRLVVYVDEDDLLQLAIQEVSAGSGTGDGGYTETVNVLGYIDLDVENIKVLNDIIERWMYQQIDKKHDCCDGPRRG